MNDPHYDAHGMTEVVTHGSVDQGAYEAISSTGELILPIARTGTAVALTDSAGDPWTAWVHWTYAGNRVVPTAITVSSDTGKAISRTLLASLDINGAVEVSHTAAVKKEAGRHAYETLRATRSGVEAPEPTEFVDDRPKIGRPFAFDEEFYRRVADEYLADTGRERGIGTRVADRLFAAGFYVSEHTQQESYRSQVRKVIQRLKDPNDPWGFIAHAQQPSTKTTGSKR